MSDEIYALAGKRVWVAGHRGMVGSAIVRRLEAENCEILTAGRSELDLTRQAEVEAWMTEMGPQVIFLAAARVGGILANDTQAAEFIYENLAIETNVIHTAWKTGVEKLLFLGSSCIYPKHAPQPMAEEALLTGSLEPTNQWYAIAKIAGLKMSQAYRRQYGCDFISAMPTNLYGPGDNFDLETSHVVPALIRKTHEAKQANAPEVTIWGDGTPRREFLYVDDLADAAAFLMRHYSDDAPINIGTGSDLSIAELAQEVAAVVGYDGAFTFDVSKPNGTPRKLLDVGKLTGLGYQAATPLAVGLAKTYRYLVDQRER